MLLVTSTVFNRVPEAEDLTVPLIIMVSLEPLAIVVNVQLLLVPASGAGVAELKMKLESWVSVTTTFWASDGPLFVTVIVYVSLVPAVTGSVESDFAVLRFALVSTTVWFVAWLFAVSGSSVSLVTLTVFNRVPEAEDLTVPLIIMVSLEPLAIVLNVHLLLVPASGAGVAELKMKLES